MIALLLAQVALFSLFPLYFSYLSGPLRRVSFYVYIALVLLIGGFYGNVYTLPVTNTINVSGGNICYGAFMMASVMFVLAERDVFVLKHLVRLVVLVDVFNVIFFSMVGYALKQPNIINGHNTPSTIFDVSIPFTILGGALIISELFFLFFCLEKIKRLRLSFECVAISCIALFILVLCVDGVLFPFIAFGMSPAVIAIVIGGLAGKFMMACLYSLALVLFILLRRGTFADYLNGESVKWSLIFTSSNKLMHDMSVKDRGLKQADIVFQTTGEGLAIVDSKGLIIKANPAFSRMVGITLNAQMSKISAKSLFYSMEDQQSEIDLERTWRGEVKFGENREHKGLLSIVPVEAKRREDETFIYTLTNIDELKQVQDKLSFLARHDPLTELANRRVLDELLSRKKQQMISLIVVDLDHFKDVNDSYGHRAGDEVLATIGERLQSVLAFFSPADFELCRTGGDEFAALVDTSDAGKIHGLCEHMQAAFSRVVRLSSGSEIHISATLGVSRQGAKESCDLLQEADAALYAAKAQKRGSIGYYKEQLTQMSQRKLHLHSKLKFALDNSRLSVFYQPQYHAKTHRIVGVEALARWHDEELGWVSPEEFIPVAEEMGLIEKLGEWVLRQACSQGYMWITQGFVDLKMSVNVSAYQLRFGQFLEVVRTILAQTQFPANALQLELTESAFIEREQEVIPLLKALKSLGIQLAIDDFGTGYSSLSYVASLPWDTLKIDRSFIDKLPEDQSQRQMTDTIIQLAKNMGLTIVVEGVETQEQLTYLAARGCDLIQGHYFSPAIDSLTLEIKLVD